MGIALRGLAVSVLRLSRRMTRASSSFELTAQCNKLFGLRLSRGVFSSVGLSTTSNKMILFKVGASTTDSSRHFDVPRILSRGLAILETLQTSDAARKNL